jgi:hypothetical protein
MSVATFEGVVVNGQIQLEADIHLPDKTKVYVIVPETKIEQVGNIFSPRLARPEQAVDFRLEVLEE